jgi:hypothetical protein
MLQDIKSEDEIQTRNNPESMLCLQGELLKPEMQVELH